MSKRVIAYDVGTTGLKTCLFEISETGIKYIAGEVGPYELYVLPNGGVEQEPADWWSAMASSTKSLLASTGIPKEGIDGITFCSQYQTVVMVDKQGNALHRAMSCMDARADKQLRNVMRKGIQVEGLNVAKVLKYIKITGAVSGSAKDPAWKYLWLRDNEPELFKATYKWLDAKEYLTCRCTGRMLATMDDAAATFLCDVQHRCWSKSLCKMLGVNYDHLPELCESTDTVGPLLPKAAEELGLAAGTPVLAGGSDVSLCSIGAGAVNPGDVLVYSGTSGWVVTTVDHLALDINNLIGAIIGADPKTYVYIAEAETAGKCMEWVKDRIDRMGMSYQEMMDYVRDTPAGSNGVVFSPWMHGNRCPFDDANSRGLFFNLDINTRGKDLMNAVIEGVCMHMRWMLECTKKKVDTNPVVRFAGGSALSSYICQVLANVLGQDVETIQDTQQVGAMGAAALAAVSFGLLKDIKDIKKVIKIDRVYHPDPKKTKVYDALMPVFRDLYFNNKKMYALLNDQDGAFRTAERAIIEESEDAK